MMAVAHPKLGVRPFLPADAALLREIFRDSIEDLISLARGRASAYVRSENGPASPGRWQVSQFFWRMGATSFAYVGATAAAGELVAFEEHADARAVITTRGTTSTRCDRPTISDTSKDSSLGREYMRDSPTFFTVTAGAAARVSPRRTARAAGQGRTAPR